MRIRFAQTIVLDKLQTAVDPSGGLPEQLRFESRVTEHVRALGGEDVVVALGHRWVSEEYVASLNVGPMVDVAELVVELDSGSFDEAFARAGPIFDAVLDYMMFVLQASIRLGQLRALDVSPPLVEGEERSFWAFTGYPFDRYARNVALGTVTTERLLTLPGSLPDLNPAARAALRWYTKSLESAYSHDTFVFLWVALECLADAAATAVTAPYRADCGHEISDCPVCGRSTSRKLRGATLQKVLVDTGVSTADARALWELRQMMHGAIPFDSHRLERLAELLQVLRVAVVVLLKPELGIDVTGLPIVVAGQMSIHPAMGLGGTTRLAGVDAVELRA